MSTPKQQDAKEAKVMMKAEGDAMKSLEVSLMDPQRRPMDGRLGSYVPSDTYLHGATLEASGLPMALQKRPSLGAACADSEPGCVLFRGPADAADAKPLAALFPLALESGDGFDSALVEMKPDLAWADQLMGDDTNVLTTTRNASYDLRGEPSIPGMYTRNQYGVNEAGSAGGAYVPSIGPYGLAKPVRQFLNGA